MLGAYADLTDSALAGGSSSSGGQGPFGGLVRIIIAIIIIYSFSPQVKLILCCIQTLVGAGGTAAPCGLFCLWLYSSCTHINLFAMISSFVFVATIVQHTDTCTILK